MLVSTWNDGRDRKIETSSERFGANEDTWSILFFTSNADENSPEMSVFCVHFFDLLTLEAVRTTVSSTVKSSHTVGFVVNMCISSNCVEIYTYQQSTFMSSTVLML